MSKFCRIGEKPPIARARKLQSGERSRSQTRFRVDSPYRIEKTNNEAKEQ